MTEGEPQVPMLPCPFCNWTAPSFQHIRDGASLECRNRTCGASVRAFNPNAIAKCAVNWNTRTTEAASTSRIRELTEALEAIEGKSRLGGDCLGNSGPAFESCQRAFYMLADIARTTLANKEQAL